METTSSPFPPFQFATLEHNVQKYKKQSQELMSFNDPAIMEEDKGKSFPNLETPLECNHHEPLPDVFLEQPVKVQGKEKKGEVAHGRVQRHTTRNRKHDIQTVKLDFGWSSDESDNNEGY